MTNIYLDEYPYSLFFKCYHVNEIDSTNTFLKNTHILFPDHSVLIADKQTNGRGRFERVWESNDDICFSIIFKKHFNNQLIAPLAIELALIDLGISSTIKWPNDIYYDNKKLCGILIEDIYEEGFLASIVGIGINMNSKKEFNAIGIKDIKNIDKKRLISAILDSYQKVLLMDNDKIIEEYVKHSMVIGKNIVYQGIEYQALGITHEGYLVLNHNGIRQVVQCDEITLHDAIIK